MFSTALFANFFTIATLCFFLGEAVIIPEAKHDGILKEEIFQSLILHIGKEL